MSAHFLTKREIKEVKSNIDLKSLSISEIEFLYDLYVTKYPAYRSFEAKLVAEVISKDLNINITEKHIEIVRDISLEQDILDKQLLHKNLGLYYDDESEK